MTAGLCKTRKVVEIPEDEDLLNVDTSDREDDAPIPRLKSLFSVARAVLLSQAYSF